MLSLHTDDSAKYKFEKMKTQMLRDIEIDFKRNTCF